MPQKLTTSRRRRPLLRPAVLREQGLRRARLRRPSSSTSAAGRLVRTAVAASSRILAREFGALVVALEHRYYGKSQPFDEITTDNLAFLSSGQALLDAVAFSVFIAGALRGAPACPRRPPAPRPSPSPAAALAASGVACSSPWIVFGGSYAGALAAWTRAFFPDFHGAVARAASCRRAIRRNSARAPGAQFSDHLHRRRVQLDLDFWQFDRQVALSYGAQCAELMSRTCTAQST